MYCFLPCQVVKDIVSFFFFPNYYFGTNNFGFWWIIHVTLSKNIIHV